MSPEFILVSAFISEGVCSKLLGRTCRGQFQLIICSFILREFEQVLLKKLSATKGETKQALRILSEAVSIISPPAQAVSGICRDIEDDHILSCSKAASADFLVTGDSDLLNLGEFQGIRIITPRDFEILFED